jgi:preprotein translocase subunit YajC
MARLGPGGAAGRASKLAGRSLRWLVGTSSRRTLLAQAGFVVSHTPPVRLPRSPHSADLIGPCGHPRTRTVVSNLLPFLPFIGIALLFWFLFIRPAQRRQRQAAQMQREVSVGDEVMLTSGIFGVVRALDEETVRIEISEGVTLRVVRAAVGQVVNAEAREARDDGTELVDDEPEEK